MRGDDQWNGSVLAAMLLGGVAITALSVFVPTEHITIVCAVLAVALTLCLWMVILFWGRAHLTIAVGCFAIFIAMWQLVTVIAYSRLAEALKNHQSSLLRSGEDSQQHKSNVSELTTESSSDTEEASADQSDPFSAAIVLIVSCNALLQIILQSLLLQYLQLDLKTFCQCLVALFSVTSALFAISITFSFS